jgi:hypothetical protein
MPMIISKEAFFLFTHLVPTIAPAAIPIVVSVRFGPPSYSSKLP